MNTYDLPLFINLSQPMGLVLLYAGPDQILPLVSILGTVIGILLIWWRRLVGLIRKGWRSFYRKSHPAIKSETSSELDSPASLEPFAEE